MARSTRITTPEPQNAPISAAEAEALLPAGRADIAVWFSQRRRDRWARARVIAELRGAQRIEVLRDLSRIAGIGLYAILSGGEGVLIEAEARVAGVRSAGPRHGE